MMIDDWKERLLAAIEADGRSYRAISMAAGLGPNFVNQFRREEKEPAAKHVIMLAKALNMSLSHLFLGNDEVTAEHEELFRLLQGSTPEGRDLALKLLSAVKPRHQGE
jgi:transcriptional regulator with XRE-family HTH domain